MNTHQREIKINTQSPVYECSYSSIILNDHKVETAQMSTDEEANKMWYSYTMNYYLAIKMVLIYAITWMNAENVPSKKKLATKDLILYDFTYMKMSRIVINLSFSNYLPIHPFNLGQFHPLLTLTWILSLHQAILLKSPHPPPQLSTSLCRQSCFLPQN